VRQHVVRSRQDFYFVPGVSSNTVGKLPIMLSCLQSNNVAKQMKDFQNVALLADNSTISVLQREASCVHPRGRERFKVAKLITNMAGRGLLRKTLFSPRLVSCLRYHLFLPSKTFILQAISNEKTVF